MNLFEMTAAARQLYEMLENDEIDEQTLTDTLENIGANEKLESYVYVQKSLEAELTAHKAEKDRHAERIAALQNHIDRLKEAEVAFMKAAGLKKAKAGSFDLSLRMSESVNIIDELQIPEAFKRYLPPKVDKMAIKKAIKSGEAVEGAEIVQSESVVAR